MGLQFFAWQQVPTPKLRPRQRPSHGTAMVAFMATDLVWAVMALAMATARGLLMPMQLPGMDTVVFTATVSQPMADTAMLDTARGLLTLRLTPGMDMEDSMVTDSQPMVVTDTDCGARRRGLPMLRPSLRLMPGLDMVDSMATVLVWAMAAMAMEGLATDTARGPLMLRPSLRPTPGSDMVDSTATVLVWAMAVLAMDMERGLLMLRPNLRLMPGLDMVDSMATDSQPMAVMATDCGERSKHFQKHRLIIICNKPNDLIGLDP